MPSPNRLAFTLIELLIVIAIVAVLAVVVILVLNPSELLKQSRDSNRLVELNALNKALSIVEVEAPGASFGSATTLYVSVPDSSLTCTNLGLPTLPAGYSYGCAPTSTLRKTDGTGWVPVNFTALTSGSPLSALPVDPVNTTSTGQYYTYIPGGSWELTALMESLKHRAAGINDGDSFPGVVSIGSTHNVTPGIRDAGLVGYWAFDESSGATANDSSGQRKNATLTNSPSWQTVTNCKMRGCLAFNGSNQSGSISGGLTLTDLTMCAWVLSTNPNGAGNPDGLSNIVGGFGILNYPSVYSSKFQNYDGANWRSATTIWSASTWYHACLTFAGANKDHQLYVNGNLEYSGAGISTATNGTLSLIAQYGNNTRFLNGRLDDLRLYNRVLSAAEITAIYNATK